MPKFTPLKVAILASGIPGPELAGLIGKDVTSLYRWTNDARKPPLEVKNALSRVLTDSPAATEHGLDTTVEGLFPGTTAEAQAEVARITELAA